MFQFLMDDENYKKCGFKLYFFRKFEKFKDF